MRKIEWKTVVEEWDGLESLTDDDRELVNEAVAGLENAYAPYSGFRVSAAIRLKSGKVVVGTNQENAAYPSGLCAERVAFFAASSAFPNDEIQAVAITAKSELFSVDHPIAPCGACRQVMLEYELKQNNSIKVIVKGTKGKIYTLSDIKGLLPLFFHEEALKKGE